VAAANTANSWLDSDRSYRLSIRFPNCSFRRNSRVFLHRQFTMDRRKLFDSSPDLRSCRRPVAHDA